LDGAVYVLGAVASESAQVADDPELESRTSE